MKQDGVGQMGDSGGLGRQEYLEMAKRGQRELSQAVEDVLNAAREEANTRRD